MPLAQFGDLVTLNAVAVRLGRSMILRVGAMRRQGRDAVDAGCGGQKHCAQKRQQQEGRSHDYLLLLKLNPLLGHFHQPVFVQAAQTFFE